MSDVQGVWLFAETAGRQATVEAGQKPATCAAWHVERLEGESLEDLIARHHDFVPIGTVLMAVEDTEVTAATVAPKVTACDPPRLEVQASEETAAESPIATRGLV